MLDQLERKRRTNQDSRLASVPQESLEAILLELGVGIEDLDEVRDAAVKNNVVVTPEDVVRFSFQRDHFWPGRFNRETYGVYYSALEPRTCIEVTPVPSKKLNKGSVSCSVLSIYLRRI
jgi:hypothetical protein